MSIQLMKGTIFESQTEALVNPVNTEGVSGAGLAKSFKERFPANQKVYENYCKQYGLSIGHILATQEDGKWIFNLPTKTYWKGPSLLEYVHQGVRALIAEMKSRGVKSVAVPALGCGNGGLSWKLVQPMIIDLFNRYGKDLEVHLYGPYVHLDPAELRQAMETMARDGLKSGVPEDQLFHYVHASYRNVVEDVEIRSVVARIRAESAPPEVRKVPDPQLDPKDLEKAADILGRPAEEKKDILGRPEGPTEEKVFKGYVGKPTRKREK